MKGWVMLCVGLALESRATQGQDSSRITLDYTDYPIQSIFKQIEQQSGFAFYYGKQASLQNEKATIRVRNENLSSVLQKLLRNQPVEWKIGHQYIVLTPRRIPSSKTVAITDSLPAYKTRLRGVVFDRAGNPVAGASLMEKRSKDGVVSLEDGTFEFQVISPQDIIVVSSVGYQTKEIRYDGRSFLQVEMDSLIRDIRTVDVVSTGFQTVPKERATGSFVLVDNKTLNRTPSTNIMDRLNFVTSGLVYDKSAPNKYTIRGVSTINASRAPLIVIDGFAYEESGNYVRVLDGLNPNDVESVSILRDAAAASIWGARSGNGVIVITTKKGNYNMKPEVSFSTNLTFAGRPKIGKIKTISSGDAIGFEKQRFAAGYYNDYDDIYPQSNYFPVVSPAVELMLAARRGEISTAELDQKLNVLSGHRVTDDITRYLTRQETRQQYNIGIRGGNNTSTYYLSAGYDREVGTAIGNGSERYTFNVNNTQRLADFLDLSYYANYTRMALDATNFTYQQMIPMDGQSSMIMAPYTMLADNSGNPLAIPLRAGLRQKYIDTLSYPGILDWNYRPLDDVHQASFSTRSDNIRLGGSLRARLVKGLSAEVKGQWMTLNGRTQNLHKASSYYVRDQVNTFMNVDPATSALEYPFPLGATMALDNSRQKSWNLRGQLNYSKSWSRHDVNMLAGIEASESKTSSDKMTLLGYDEQTLTSKDVNPNTLYPTRPGGGLAAIWTPKTVGYTLNRYLSYYGNASYILDRKYSLSGSIRWDAANLFGVSMNDRRVPLWSAGGSWNIAGENFMNDVTWMDQLKLRVTYGWNGNMINTISSQPIIQYFNSTNLYNTAAFARITSPPNPNLTWEKVKVLNFGLDFSCFRQRLSGSLEYYRKNGDDLIGLIINDATKGFSRYEGNYASIKGYGWDVQLNGLILDKKSITWRAQWNISFNKERIISYNYIDPKFLEYGDSYIASGAPIVGAPLSPVYSYRWGGLNAGNGNPQGYLSDTLASYNTVLSDNNLKPGDLVYHGSATPRINGNFLHTLTWKDLSLSFNLRYRFDYYIRRPSILYSELISNWSAHNDYANRWQKPGDERSTNVPSASLTPNALRDRFYRFSSILVEKGDHIRLQDIVLDYTLPSRLFNNKIGALTLRAMASNLGVIWRANDYNIDPENPVLPLPASYTFGIHVKL